MARTKAAVFPVPDCDWAIRFCGLKNNNKELDSIKSVKKKRVK